MLRDTGLISGLGRSPGGRHGNPLQYSCLENPTNRGAWWATVHGFAKSQTWLKWLSTHSVHGAPIYEVHVKEIGCREMIWNDPSWVRLSTSSCYDTALHHSFCGTFSLGLGGNFLRLTGILAHTYKWTATVCMCVGEELMTFKPLHSRVPLDPVTTARSSLPAAGESSDLCFMGKCCCRWQWWISEGN